MPRLAARTWSRNDRVHGEKTARVQRLAKGKPPTQRDGSAVMPAGGRSHRHDSVGPTRLGERAALQSADGRGGLSMSGQVIGVMAGLIFCYALVARGLLSASLTSPMLASRGGNGVLRRQLRRHQRGLRPCSGRNHSGDHSVPRRFDGPPRPTSARPGIALRLLMIGFPLALVATFLVSRALFPAVGIAGAWLIAAAITPPTPAWVHPRCSIRLCRCGSGAGWNVESGLNDGLATPIVLMALAVLAEREDAPIPACSAASGWHRCSWRSGAQWCWRWWRRGAWTVPGSGICPVGEDVRSPP